MFWFEYTYNTTAEILSGVKRVIDFSPIEIALLVGLLAWVIASILYIIPFLMWIHSKRKKENSKKKRKKLLSQISMQKEIEDEIAAEIENTHQ